MSSSSSSTAFGKIGRLLGGRGGTSEDIPRPIERLDATQTIRLMHDYENSGAGFFWSTTSEGKLNYMTEASAQRLGRTGEDIIGIPFLTLFAHEKDDDDAVERTLPLLLPARKTFSDLPVRADIDGEEVWWSISGRPQYDAAGNFSGYFGNGVNITDARRTQKDASRLAMFDSLTGLANRNRMTKRLTATLTAYKVAKRACALMMLDLDRFKQVNDTLGHPAGDELLKQVAQRLQRAIPDGCEIGRLGGDEFQVMLPDIDDRGRLGEISRKIIEMVSQPYSIDGSRCVIGCSVGVAIAPYDGIDSEELVRSADLALYAAKDGGRGTFRFYSRDLHAEAERRRLIEEDLRDALEAGQIWLAYQPIVATKNNTVVGLEAVMRWNHPELGAVSPAVFIPIAEEANLIGGLGDWALRRACEDAVRWPGNVRVAVNVSPAQFGNLNFPTVVAKALSASGLAPERLELEVTESIFLSDDDHIQQMFKSLKILGVRLSLDDFGTGYSSLGYLKKADFDKIKIDQGFIRGVTEKGSRNVAIIRSIVSLAEGLGMETTAEGIEAHDELEEMRALKVQTIQGFIYAQPLPFEDVYEAMANGSWVIEPNGPSKYRQDRMTMLRKVGLIHEDHRYEVLMRNLSRSGCLVEGLLDVPVGTNFVVDFGEGQLAVAIVRRSAGHMQGLEFEMPLVDDGAGGLCTRNRVSPYVLAAAGMPLTSLPKGAYPLAEMHPPSAMSMPQFAQVNETGRKSLRAS